MTDLNKERELEAQIESFKKEAMELWFVPNLADTYKNKDLFSYSIMDGEVFFMREQARQLWNFWNKAKAQAVPEGCVLVTEDQAKDSARLDFMLDDFTKRTVCHQKHWSDDGDLIKEGQCVAEIYYISGWDYMYESISDTKRQAIDKAMHDESESGAEG